MARATPYRADSGIHQGVSEPAVLRLPNALVVMARHPQPGRVKTRLAARIGNGAAAEIYRAFLVDIAARLGEHPGWTLHWAFEPAGAPFASVIGGAPAVFPQPVGDLGARMAAALGRVLSLGHRHAVLIGSDVPHLPLDTIEEAFARLSAGAELVLAPADDGGYCLIGARSVPRVFEGIRWGTADVLVETVDAARRVGIEPVLLAPCYDVDDEAALERLRADLRIGRAPDLVTTRRVLEQAILLGYK